MVSINHSLSFPILAHETATSYVSRLTRYCGLASPNDFCLDHGFRWQDFVRGDDFLFDKAAAIGGASAEDMKRWAVRTVAHNRFQVSGQLATKMSLARTRLRICPRCLIEDRERHWRLGPYHRHQWHFLSMRSCAVHDVPMVTLAPEKYTIQNYDFASLVQNNWACIQSEARASGSRHSTSMERYLCKRLEGQMQNPFLDDMPMYIATRLCEVLGFVLEYGPDRKISEGSEDDLSRAGQTGFEALHAGEEGLYASLDTLVSPIGLRTVRHRSDLGAFFEWLRPSSIGTEFEPLRRLVRDYIFRTYPCREGDFVLGQACPQTTKYSIHGVWKSLGVQRERLNRFLIAEGVAQKNEGDAEITLHDGLSAQDLTQFSEHISNRLTISEASNILNVSTEFLMLLRKSGIVEPIVDALDQVPKYERRSLESLLERLASSVTSQVGRTDEMVPIIEAARRIRCPATDIVQLVLNCALDHVARDINVPGISGFRVRLPEVRAALPPLEMDGVTKGEAATTLRVTYQTINYLIEEGLLRSQRVRNPKSRQFLDAVCTDSIAEFQQNYETLGQLAHRYQRASGPLGCHLEAKGVCPFETPQGISWYYNRSGLNHRLKKAGLVVPDLNREPSSRA
ncbi:MAG: TniQ family protein [Roseobacter sp.]